MGSDHYLGAHRLVNGCGSSTTFCKIEIAVQGKLIEIKLELTTSHHLRPVSAVTAFSLEDQMVAIMEPTIK
jgi:hypothetical protein